MKKHFTLTLFLLFQLSFYNIFAQKLTVINGNLEFLKNTTKILVKYKYDRMEVGKMSEIAYLEKRSQELNQKEPGRGDSWKVKWYEDRKKRFEPKFEELFNKVLQNKGVSVNANYPNADYVMTIHTQWTEPGYFASYFTTRYGGGLPSEPALISGKITFTEVADSSKILSEMMFDDSPGKPMGAPWDTGERIKESYAKLGKSLATFLIKNKVF